MDSPHSMESRGLTMPQVTVTLSKQKMKELQKLRDETGLPMSKLVQLDMNGFTVIRKKPTDG